MLSYIAAPYAICNGFLVPNRNECKKHCGGWRRMLSLILVLYTWLGNGPDTIGFVSGIYE